jgi:hypothetical protein
MKKITTLEMEVAVANFMNWRANLIIPNVSWSFFMHECDLIRISRAGYCTEIEIKISKSDLIADKNKKWGHHHEKISQLYFAIPKYLHDYIEYIPERAGIIIVDHERKVKLRRTVSHKCKILRPPKKNNNYQFTEREVKKCLELMAMRIWGLKSKLNRLKNETKK